jgi:hypothetical protein
MSNEAWKRNLPVPYFSQRESKYKWRRIAKNIENGGETVKIQLKYGIDKTFYTAGENIGKPVSLAWASCNIVSLCMILHYFGITDDTPDEMMRRAFEEKNWLREANVGYKKYTGASRLQHIDNIKEIAIAVYGNIPLEIKQYIDFMTQSLFGYKNTASELLDYHAAYFYQWDQREDQYRGEWIRHLYGERGDRKILAFDIELGWTYNEGVRGGWPRYDHNKIENTDMPFSKKENNQASGFFVPEGLRKEVPKNIEGNIFPITSFYNFLVGFFNNKKEIDDKMRKSPQSNLGQQ